MICSKGNMISPKINNNSTISCYKYRRKAKHSEVKKHNQLLETIHKSITTFKELFNKSSSRKSKTYTQSRFCYMKPTSRTTKRSIIKILAISSLCSPSLTTHRSINGFHPTSQIILTVMSAKLNRNKMNSHLPPKLYLKLQS